MSYRNPKQIVDTQSGQYVRDLQKSLAGTFSDYASEQKKEYERRAKLNEEVVAKSQERINRISGQLNQVANANKATNLDQMYDLLDEYGEYMKINPSKRTREMNSFITNMDNSGTTIKNMLANTTAGGQDYVAAREKGLGVMGGLRKDADTGVLNKNDILYGYNQAPGSKKLNFDPRGLSAEVRIDVLNENGSSAGSSLNPDMDNLSIPQIIPDETSDMQEVADRAAAEMDLKNPNSPAYAGQPESSIEEGEGSNKFRKSRLPSKENFLIKAKPYAKAQVESLTAGEAIALYNDVLRKEGADTIVYQKTWIQDSPESIAAKEIITDAYAEYTADKFAQSILTKGLKFGSVETKKPPTKKDKPDVVETGKAFYDRVKENPISSLREYTGVKGVYDEGNNTITINATDRKGYDGDEDLVFNMNDPDSKIDFYTRLFKASEAGDGTGKDAKLMRKQFSEALRAETKEKLGEKSKSDFEKFATEWDKNNPSPYNSSFRMKSIMDAYKESKKNSSNEAVKEDVEKVNSITSTITEKNKIKAELNNIINNSNDPKKIITEISKSDTTVARNPLNFANKYLGFDENNEQHQEVIQGFLNGAIPNLVKNKKDVAQDTSAWCAAFVNGILKQGKFSTLDYGEDNYNLIRAKEYEKIGTKVDGISSAKEGDIVVTRKRLTNDKGQKYWQYHTGFYSGKKNGEYTMLGGNQNNKVSVRAVTKEEVYATRRIKDVEEMSESNRNKILNTEFFDKTKKQEVR